MKKKVFLLLPLIVFGFFSCNDDSEDGEYADYVVARPLVMSKTEFASSIDVIAPLPIDESVKSMRTKIMYS